MISLFNSFIRKSNQDKLKPKLHFSFICFLSFLIILNSPFLLSGCNTTKTVPYPAKGDILSSLQMHLLVPHPLPVMAWTPPKQSTNKTIRIYIEGDGKAWIRKGRPSSDPTPENRLVHYLMKEDRQTDIAYLGRPCQYIQTSECHSKIWTFERYSKSIIALMSYSVDKIKQHGSYQQVELVGYSGGATIALLLAAQRDDIISIRTVAGNLAPAFTNNLHGVTEMLSAMNPLDFRKALSHIPQIHFYGTSDSVIPDKISHHYFSQMNNSECITIKPVPASHHSGWAERWQELLKAPPECKTTNKISPQS